MDTGFLSTTIRSIARRSIFPYYFWLTVITLSACSFLALLSLGKMINAAFFSVVILGTLIICGLIIRSIRMVNRIIKNPLESHFTNALKRYGPLEETIAQIDSEATPYIGTIGSFATKHWLISAQSTSLSFLRLEDVVWIYKQVKQGSLTLYFVFTVSRWEYHAAKIWDRWGNCTTVPSSSEGVDRLLGTIANNVPWVSKGHLDYLMGAWNSKRTEFIAAVDQRRREYQLSGSILAEDNLEKKAEDRAISQPMFTSLPITSGPNFEYNLNHPLVRAGIEEGNKQREKNTRFKGILLSFAGLVGSILFILPIVYGILENQEKLSFSNLGISISLMFLMFGVYYIAFGRKGELALERAMGKSCWTLMLFVTLLPVTAILISRVVNMIVGLFGYQVARGS